MGDILMWVFAGVALAVVLIAAGRLWAGRASDEHLDDAHEPLRDR